MTESSSEFAVADHQGPQAVIQTLYRIFKLALVHDLQNEALNRVIDQAVTLFRTHTVDSPEGSVVSFHRDTVLIDGQLLRATRVVYENAMELAERLMLAGFNRVRFTHEVTKEEILAGAAEFLSRSLRSSRPPGFKEMSDGFSLGIADEALQLGADADLSVAEIMSQTFAYAATVVSGLIVDVQAGRYLLSRQVKRLCQRLVMLADSNQTAFTALASMPHSFHDAPSRAVSSAVVAVSMGRLVTRDLKTLSRLAMSAMLFEVGIPRAVALEEKRQSEHLEDDVDPHTRVPTSSAFITAALGGMRDDAVFRTVFAFEAQWLHREERLGALYGGQVSARFESALVRTVWRYNHLITGLEGPKYSRDLAFVILANRASGDEDLHLVQMLGSALGIYPIGTPVLLTSGWRGIVSRTPDHPALFRRPQVCLVVEPGGQAQKMHPVDLAVQTDLGQISSTVPCDHPAMGAVRDHLLGLAFTELGWAEA